MIVMGIDPSLTATGIVLLKDGQVVAQRVTKNNPELNTVERVAHIRSEIWSIPDDITNKGEPWEMPNLIVIEGFSYGSKGRSVFDIAYLGWRIREDLESLIDNDGIPWIEVPPTQLKQFATGKGNANKEIILQQVYKRWNYETDNNNIADAFVLAKIGEAYLMPECDLLALPVSQQDVILTLKGKRPRKLPKKKVTPCD